MKIIIRQHVQLKNFSDGHYSIIREFDSGVKPSKGEEYYDSLFEASQGREIKGVALDYENNTCYVRLESEILSSKSKQDLQAYVESAKTYGWKVLAMEEKDIG